jgi:hypothetical protein
MNQAKPFDTMPINREVIALFARGPSVNEIPLDLLARVVSSCFTLVINDVAVVRDPDCRFWMDVPNAEKPHWDWAFTWPKGRTLWATRPSGTKHIEGRVDYLIAQEDPSILGNTSVYTALQMIRRHWPDKTVLMFGVDCNPERDAASRVWSLDGSSRTLDFNFAQRERYADYLTRIREDLDSHARGAPEWAARIINVSPVSALEHFPRMTYADAVYKYCGGET